MIARQLTYIKMIEYIENLATQNTHIKSFIPFSEKQFAVEIGKSVSMEDPILVLFNYQAKLDGNNQRTFATRSISFAIVSRVVKVDDFDAQYLIINQAEEIGLSVISRIHFDSRKPDSFWLYNNFNKNSVRFSEILGKSTDNLFGMEFHFDLKVPEPLSVDAADWEDLTNIC